MMKKIISIPKYKQNLYYAAHHMCIFLNIIYFK
jgi:hypothetical protein